MVGRQTRTAATLPVTFHIAASARLWAGKRPSILRRQQMALPKQAQGKPLIPHVLDTLPFRIPANNNTPTVRQRILAHWRAQAPENDSEIFSRPAETVAPRLAHLEEDCKPLVTWRRLRDASESDGLGTNWMSAHELPEPANDNQPAARSVPQRDFDLTEDTADALLRRLGSYVAEEKQEAVLRRDETGELYIAERRARLMLVGHADGEFQRYPGTKFRAKPRSRRKLEAPGAVARCGNAYFSGPEHRIDGFDEGTLCFVDSKRRFRRVEEDYDMRPLDSEGRGDGKQNNHRPPENQVPDTEDIIDARQTLALLQASRGKSGPLLTPDNVLVLDTAIRAQNFNDVGLAAGHTGDYAKKAGKRLTIAACKSLARGLQEILGKCAA